MKIIDRDMNKTGKFTKGQLEITEISEDMRKLILEEVFRLAKKQGFEPYNLDCQILIDGFWIKK